MTVYDYKNYKAVEINTISDVIELLNYQEVDTLFSFLSRSIEESNDYFISNKRLNNTIKKYNQNKISMSYYKNIKYLSRSLATCSNSLELTKLVSFLHFNNFTIDRLINMFNKTKSNVITSN